MTAIQHSTAGAPLQMQTEVTAYFKSKQLLLFAFAGLGRSPVAIFPVQIDLVVTGWTATIREG